MLMSHINTPPRRRWFSKGQLLKSGKSHAARGSIPLYHDNFIPEYREAEHPSDGRGWPSGRVRADSGDQWENPLVRCGIALAGANSKSETRNPKSEIEDGLLTGLEASLLNLQGTELVILSACDSGTGEVKIGEGVMSLRRAFRIAGAQTVLASHWKVSDKATSQLMTELIRRWRSGEPRAKAWREAQLSLLHSKDFQNPYFCLLTLL